MNAREDRDRFDSFHDHQSERPPKVKALGEQPLLPPSTTEVVMNLKVDVAAGLTDWDAYIMLQRRRQRLAHILQSLTLTLEFGCPRHAELRMSL